MIINRLGVQLISEQTDIFGMSLKAALDEYKIKNIEAGTIMVARFNESVKYLFEVNFAIKVETLRGASPVYAMPGSRLPLRVLPAGLTEGIVRSRTLLFRDCRLPTTLEYNKYLSAITV